MPKTEDIQEPNKKRRIRKACNYCRSKKAKCDGATPSCSTCIAASEICTYTESTKRRGLPTGYTHDLEKKVILLQGLLSELLKNTPDKGLENNIFQLLTNKSRSQEFIDNLGRLQSIWESSSFAGVINQFISNNGPAIHEAKNSIGGILSHSNTSPSTLDTKRISSSTQGNSKFTQLFNPQSFDTRNDFQLTNKINFNSSNTYKFNTIDRHTLTNNLEHSVLKDDQNYTSISGFTSKSIWEYKNRLKLNESDPFRIGSIFNITSASIKASETQIVELPREVFAFNESFREQINRYFTIYHSWIPLVDRILIIRKLHEFKSFDVHISLIESSQCNMVALLWAVIALGELASYSLTSSKESSDLFAKRAIMALENSPDNSIEAIQTCVLLSLFYYQIGKWDYSWVLICSGARSALDARLMNESTDSIVKDKKPQEKSKILDSLGWERTWSSVYVVNTILAARLGRTLYIKSADWPVPKINEDGWEEWEHWKIAHSVNPIELDSGRCLLTYNKLIEVISILNLSITCTIDINDEGHGDEFDAFRYKARNDKSYTYTLSSFKRKIDEWTLGLPNHCQLNYYSNITKLPPMIALLHLCLSLIWCILAVRFYHLNDGSNWININIAKLRDQHYTSAVLTIRQILNSSNLENLKYYPFIDYFLLMASNYPEMLSMGENDRAKHCREVENIFTRITQTSIPASISWEILKIMREGKQPNEITNLESSVQSTSNIPDLSTPSQLPPLLAKENMIPSQLVTPSPLPLPTARDERDNILPAQGQGFMPFYNSQFLNVAPFGNRFHSTFDPNNLTDIAERVKFQPTGEIPPNQALSTFMLDSDFAVNDLRFDTFMKNLGYISNDRNESANESQNTSPLSTTTLGANLEMQLGNEIENIGIRDYIQRMSEKNG